MGQVSSSWGRSGSSEQDTSKNTGAWMRMRETGGFMEKEAFEIILKRQARNSTGLNWMGRVF